ncbi:MAG: hypothetical protein IJQ84_09670 [Paludibacteraceae bacterium]|nr:hypothetical protein [Paludibacteraceae bacterium]
MCLNNHIRNLPYNWCMHQCMSLYMRQNMHLHSQRRTWNYNHVSTPRYKSLWQYQYMKKNSLNHMQQNSYFHK